MPISIDDSSIIGSAILSSIPSSIPPATRLVAVNENVAARASFFILYSSLVVEPAAQGEPYVKSVSGEIYRSKFDLATRSRKIRESLQDVKPGTCRHWSPATADTRPIPDRPALSPPISGAEFIGPEDPVRVHGGSARASGNRARQRRVALMKKQAPKGLCLARVHLSSHREPPGRHGHRIARLMGDVCHTRRMGAGRTMNSARVLRRTRPCGRHLIRQNGPRHGNIRRNSNPPEWGMRMS